MGQRELPVDDLRITTPTEPAQRGPQLQRVAPACAQLAVAEEVETAVVVTAPLVEVLGGAVERRT
jgi:hypothetical protein